MQRQGIALHELLQERFGAHPHIGDIRGRGLLRAIELVEDRESKQPFASSLKLHARIKQQAMLQGLICYPGGGTADGDSGDHVLIAPPFNVTDSQLEQIVDSLKLGRRCGDKNVAALKLAGARRTAVGEGAQRSVNIH